MSQENPIIQAGAPERGKGLALRNVYSSVVAGVGGVIPRQAEVYKPELQDYKDDEAFRKFKEFNTNTNLRVNERVMWGNTLERVSGWLLSGMALAIGSALVAAAKESLFFGLVASEGTAVAIAGTIGIGAMVAISIGVFHAFSQVASREQSDKFMDVDDFRMKRSAGLIAQEIKKALAEDGVDVSKGASHTRTREVIVVQQAANENNAPKITLSADAGARELGAKLVAQGSQAEIA